MGIMMQVEGQNPMGIYNISEYSFETKIPENSLARNYEIMNTIRLSIQLPKSEDNTPQMKYLKQWNQVGDEDKENFYRPVFINVHTVGNHEKTLYFSHAKIMLERTGVVQADFHTYNIVLMQKDSKYNHITIGSNVKKTKEKYEAFKKDIELKKNNK